MQPPIPAAQQHSSGSAMLIEAEAHARCAARLIELDPGSDAQREARILYLAAQRIRARRLGTAA